MKNTFKYLEIRKKYNTYNNFSTYNGDTINDYIIWLRKWRNDYKDLSKYIRYLKINRNPALCDNYSLVASELCCFRKLATIAMQFRMEAKELIKTQEYLKENV